MEEYTKLCVVYESLSNLSEMVQSNGLCGGHRGSLDHILTESINVTTHRMTELETELGIKEYQR